MTAVVFLEEAEDELLEAIRYYTDHSRALGVDFVTEVQAAKSAQQARPIAGNGLKPLDHSPRRQFRIPNSKFRIPTFPRTFPLYADLL